MNLRDSTHIRIRKLTKRRLESLGLRWQAAGQAGDEQVAYNPDGERVSLDAIINILLDRDEAHRVRSIKARRARFDQKASEEARGSQGDQQA